MKIWMKIGERFLGRSKSISNNGHGWFVKNPGSVTGASWIKYSPTEYGYQRWSYSNARQSTIARSKTSRFSPGRIDSQSLSK